MRYICACVSFFLQFSKGINAMKTNREAYDAGFKDATTAACIMAFILMFTFWVFS